MCRAVGEGGSCREWGRLFHKHNVLETVEPQGTFKQPSDTVKSGFFNNQPTCMGVQDGKYLGVFCNCPREEDTPFKALMEERRRQIRDKEIYSQ